jgi:hypothetical protein
MDLTRRAFLVATAPALVASLMLSCSSSSGSAAPPPVEPVPDAGPDVAPPPAEPVDAGTPITITTYAPASSTSPAAKTNATWAAYRTVDGTWTRVDPSAPATYIFPANGDTWSIAFACADNQSSLVAVYERAVSVTTFDATLETWCGPPPPAVYTLTGHLTNVPTTTSWLDFGYGLELRGAAIPIAGTAADYEEVNMASGTWDLMFGLRDESTSPLSKIALVRGHALTADGTLDVDLAGAAAVPTTTKALILHGLRVSEAVAAPVYYTTGGGLRGLDLGQSLPPPAVDVTTTYTTLPAAVQTATDRYRLELLIEDGDSAARGVKASFHAASDIEVTAPGAAAEPMVSVAGTTPYLRIAATVATRKTASLYEVETFARISNKSRVVWRISNEAGIVAGATGTFTMPDLSTGAGWNTEWVLPSDYDRTTTATIYDKELPLGDGTLQSWTSRSVSVTP